MEINGYTKISDITNFNFRTTELFEKYGIDYCCGGKKHLSDVCSDKKINLDDVLNDLKKYSFGEDIFNDWDLGFLIDYIVNAHHSYLRKYLPQINGHLSTLVNKHSGKYPQLKELELEFMIMKKELEEHILKEENVLFPYIKNLVNLEITKSEFSVPPFGSIENPISVMEREHSEAGQSLENIKTLTHNFLPEDSFCNTHKITYKELEDLYKDLHKHIHLENNILFPKAKKLEEKIFNSACTTQDSVCKCNL